MYFKMIQGDFPTKTLMAGGWGSAMLSWGFGKNGRLLLKGQVAGAEVLTDEQTKSFAGSAVGAAVGGVLLGPLGLVVGGLAAGNKKRLLVDCKLIDGRGFIAETDSEGYKLLLGCATRSEEAKTG